MQYEKWDYFKVASTELAQALGVTRGTVWRWQTGLSKPTRRHQERVEQVLQELAPLVLPELRSEKPDKNPAGRIIRPNAPTRLQPLPNSKDREPTLFENERTFRQTAQLVSDGWLPPETTYKGQTSRTPFDEGRFREIAKDIAAELRDSLQN